MHHPHPLLSLLLLREYSQLAMAILRGNIVEKRVGLVGCIGFIVLLVFVCDRVYSCILVRFGGLRVVVDTGSFRAVGSVRCGTSPTRDVRVLSF